MEIFTDSKCNVYMWTGKPGFFWLATPDCVPLRLGLTSEYAANYLMFTWQWETAAILPMLTLLTESFFFEN